MKKKASNRKLTLTTETVRHLKQLRDHDLDRIRGGGLAAGTDSGTCSGYADCTTTQV